MKDPEKAAADIQAACERAQKYNSEQEEHYRKQQERLKPFIDAHWGSNSAGYVSKQLFCGDSPVNIDVRYDGTQYTLSWTISRESSPSSESFESPEEVMKYVEALDQRLQQFAGD